LIATLSKITINTDNIYWLDFSRGRLALLSLDLNDIKKITEKNEEQEEEQSLKLVLGHPFWKPKC